MGRTRSARRTGGGVGLLATWLGASRAPLAPRRRSAGGVRGVGVTRARDAPLGGEPVRRRAAGAGAEPRPAGGLRLGHGGRGRRGGRRGRGAAARPARRRCPSACSAAASSTEEEAVLASTPAACSFSSSSLLERPCSLAISCTRFLLIWPTDSTSSPGRVTAQRSARAIAPARRWRAPGSRPRARPRSHRDTGRPRDRASCRSRSSTARLADARRRWPIFDR